MVFVRHLRLSNTCYQDFFFTNGSVLKGKSKNQISLPSNSTSVFLRSRRFEKKKKLIHFVLCSCSQLWTAPAPWLTKCWGGLDAWKASTTIWTVFLTQPEKEELILSCCYTKQDKFWKVTKPTEHFACPIHTLWNTDPKSSIPTRQCAF